jgi:hypothetical protein
MLNKSSPIFERVAHWLAVALLLTAGGTALAQDQDADPPGRVARVNTIEGQASVQLAGDTEWTTDVINRPLTTGDKVWVDVSSRAEMHVGSAAVRMGERTGVELLNLNDQVMQLRLTAGSVSIRVRELQRDESVEVDTPNVSVALLQPGEYRLDVDDDGQVTQVAVVSGHAEVTGPDQTYRVDPRERGEFRGTNDLRADVGDINGPDALDLWAEQRDAREDHAESARYVSRDVPGYQDLDEYGSWDDDPTYGPLWAPRVAVGWAPYQSGHWVWISPWGWTWVDEAPWGFAPSHYGRWVHTHERWCWSPGRRGFRPVYAPALVAWVGGSHFSVGVSSGSGVGWFPLGYNEVYRPAYRVSNHYIRNVNVTNTYINNTTIINNTTVITERDRRPYANQRVPGAVTAVQRDVFVSARPVGRHIMPVDQRMVAGAVATTAGLAIAPTLRSRVREPRDSAREVRAVAPSAAVFARPIVTRRVPPPVAPSFEAQRQAVIANGARPVPLQQVTRSREYPQVPVRIVRPADARPIEASRPDASGRPAVGRREQVDPRVAPRSEPQVPASVARPAGVQEPANAQTAAPVRNDRPPSAVRPFDRYAHPVPAERPAVDDARVRQQQEAPRREIETRRVEPRVDVQQQRAEQNPRVEQAQRAEQMQRNEQSQRADQAQRAEQAQRADQQRQMQQQQIQQRAEQQRQVQQQQQQMQQRAEQTRREPPPPQPRAVEPVRRAEPPPAPRVQPQPAEPRGRPERGDASRDRR